MIDATGAGAAAAAYGRSAPAGQVVGASPAGGGGDAPGRGGSLGGGSPTGFDRREARVAEAGYQDAVRIALAQFCPASGDCGPDLPSRPVGAM